MLYFIPNYQRILSTSKENSYIIYFYMFIFRIRFEFKIDLVIEFIFFEFRQ